MMLPPKMDDQDSSGGNWLNSFSMSLGQIHMDAQTSPLSNPQFKEMGLPVDEQLSKVRKPYTITKQREKWTEEEHRKFLEALQLHGRAWRRIEEHIGTKTAVQIRSHAQKFFSKVVRESASTDGSSSLKVIEIPPPRPKRKPSHPYPRKQGNSPSKSMTTLKQPDKCSLQIISGYEIENRSPTSVLSIVRSGTLDSLKLSPQHCDTTPVASADGSSDHYSAGQSSISTVVHNKVPPLGLEFCSSTMKGNAMELERLPGENLTAPESSSPELQAKTIRLFGKTVALIDSQSQSPSSNLSTIKYLNQNNTDSHQLCVHNGQHNLVAHSINSCREFAQDPERSVLPSYTGENIAPFTPFEYIGESSTTPPTADFPWSALWRNLPFQVLDAQTKNFGRLFPSSTTAAFYGQQTEREDSLTCSDDDSICRYQNFDGMDYHIKNESRLKPGDASDPRSWKFHEPTSGFLPYKRCIAESEEKTAKDRDDGDSQAIRLCL